MRAGGAMISFCLKGGKEEGLKFANSLKKIAVAESLGGTKTMLNVPALMTHTSVPEE